MTLLTLAEVAERLHVSTGTVRALSRDGLPLIRVSPRRYLVENERDKTAKGRRNTVKRAA